MTDIIKNGTDDAKVSLDSDAGDPPAQILRTIQVVEEHLRVKRSRIEEIQTRHDGLVEELRKLDETLESESLDFVSNLKAVIDDYDVGSVAEASQADAPTATEPAELKAGGANRGKAAPKTAKAKPTKRGSLRWLKDKERSGQEDS